jgi:signal peptidase II
VTEASAAPAALPGDHSIRRAWFLLLALAVVGLDQLAKWGIRSWIERGERWPEDGPLRLVHVTNSGAAFGMLQGAAGMLAVVSVVGATALLVYLFNPGLDHPGLRLGLALMLGGAVGNLVDRVREGEVIDFLKVPHWPAFNLADSAISIGVVLLLWVMVFRSPGPNNTAN